MNENEKIFDLIKNNDIANFKNLADNSTYLLLEENSDNLTPFQFCCIEGKIEFLKFMIHFAKNLGGIITDTGETCLMLTAHNDKVDAFKLIYDNYPEQKIENNNSISFITIKHKSYNIIKFIKDNNLDIDFDNKYNHKHTPLYYAVQKKDQELVNLILPLIKSKIRDGLYEFANNCHISLELQTPETKTQNHKSPSPRRRKKVLNESKHTKSKSTQQTPSGNKRHHHHHDNSKTPLISQNIDVTTTKQEKSIKSISQNSDTTNKTTPIKQEKSNKPSIKQIIQDNDAPNKQENKSKRKPRKRRTPQKTKVNQDLTGIKKEVQEMCELLEKHSNECDKQFIDKYNSAKEKYGTEICKTKDSRERLLIHAASKYDHEDENIIQTLNTDYHESLSIPNQNNRLPLYISICNGAFETFQLLYSLCETETIKSVVRVFVQEYYIDRSAKKRTNKTPKDFLQFFFDMGELVCDGKLNFEINKANKNALTDLKQFKGYRNSPRSIQRSITKYLNQINSETIK